MNRFSKQTIDAVKVQLNAWFERQLPRGSDVRLSELRVDLPSAVLAAKLYKRNGVVIEGLPVSEPTTTRARDTRVFCFNTWDEFFSRQFPGCELIVDKNVFLMIESNDGFKKSFCTVHLLDCTEHNKNIDTVFDLANKISPTTKTIVSIGGGIASDVAGCVAGLIDCELVVVPTTWLAGVDAAIGGKNGVNHPVYGKNQIGLFLNPTKFCIVDEAFKTLTRAQFLCGFAEAMKHRWLAGDAQLANLTHLKNPVASPASFLRLHIEFKRMVVEHDPFEQHVRKTLNLGHTYGHVFEALGEQGYLKKIPHGAAVALGLQIKASSQPKLPSDFLQTLTLLSEALLKEFPVTVLKPIDTRIVTSLLLADKKRSDDLISVVSVDYGAIAQITSLSEDHYLSKLPVADVCARILSRIY